MEYVDGRLLERHVGEYFQSRLQFLIGQVLGSRERERRYRVFTEQRVRVSDGPRYRIPDLCVKALRHKVTPVLTRPDLVIEVLPPDDQTSEMLTKIADYQQAGIPHIWLVDPYRRTLVESVDGRLRRPEGHVLGTPLVGEIDFAVLFAELHEPAE